MWGKIICPCSNTISPVSSTFFLRFRVFILVLVYSRDLMHLELLWAPGWKPWNITLHYLKSIQVLQTNKYGIKAVWMLHRETVPGSRSMKNFEGFPNHALVCQILFKQSSLPSGEYASSLPPMHKLSRNDRSGCGSDFHSRLLWRLHWTQVRSLRPVSMARTAVLAL